MSLAGRRIVLGVSGGIAAYKAVYLARRLVDAGAEVRVVMTSTATEFVGAASFAAITGHPVIERLTTDQHSVSPHTELARWADAVLVAPATAATLSRLAHGLADDALAATVIAARAPILVVPAMHAEMWEYPGVRRSIELLTSDGVTIVGPTTGTLAGGDEGVGRMVEPEEIVTALVTLLGSRAGTPAGALAGTLAGTMAGIKVLVTAGGTREPIDPVRYIGNRSSGRMGHAIAEEAARRGAAVTLVTCSPLPTSAGVERRQVETAAEMAEEVAGVIPDVAVMAAAVADFRPSQPHEGKLARSDGPPEIRLEPTVDILATVTGRSRRPFVVGFAAETGGLERAVDKARNKGVDLLVANDVTAPGAGFAVETNLVTVIRPDGSTEPWPLMSKNEVASRLWDLIERSLEAEPGGEIGALL